MQVLAVDPGREKCGVTLARIEAREVQVIERAIWPRAQFLEHLHRLLSEQEVDAFVLGNATTSRQMKVELEQARPQTPVHMVDERNSTLEARDLYWKSNPPSGLKKLIPLSLQCPPEPVDDFAAEVLARRFAAGGAST